MSKSSNKFFLIIAWIAIVFGYLYLLQFVFDKVKNFHLFVFLAIAGNLAYDGLKAVIRYEPLYPSDASTISKYVVGFVASLTSSVVFIYISAELFFYGILRESHAQILSGIGFLASISAGMWLLAKAEVHFKMSNRA